MQTNTEKYKHLLEEGLILESDLADGSLQKIFGPVKQNLGKFGSIIADSAKLIGGDIGFLVKLTFGRLQTLKDLKRMDEQNNARRGKYLKSIAEKSDNLMDQWPDGKITSMLVAPGLFFTSSALSGVQKVTSPEFRSMVGEFGFNQVPILGRFFDDSNNSATLFGALASCEPGDGECMRRALSGSAKESGGILSRLATKINSIFLISHHSPEGQTLLEGEETVEANELTEEQEKYLLQEIKSSIDSHLEDSRRAYMDGKKKYYDKIIKEATMVISLNSELAATNEVKTFLAALEKLQKLGGDAVDIDIEKVKSGMSSLSGKIKEDETSMKEIQKTFEEENIEQTEENLNNKLEEIVLSSMKSQFLQALRESLSDYYETVYTKVSGGIEKSKLKVLAKDSHGKEFVELVNEYEKKLKEALSKLEQS
jgi:hypothetical protein